MNRIIKYAPSLIIKLVCFTVFQNRPASRLNIFSIVCDNYVDLKRILHSDRNAYCIPDYFRVDLTINVDGNHKVHQKTHNSWTFGVYNLTGRKNPYSVYFVAENGVISGYKLSIFGSVIPFVNFNIRF